MPRICSSPSACAGAASSLWTSCALSLNKEGILHTKLHAHVSGSPQLGARHAECLQKMKAGVYAGACTRQGPVTATRRRTEAAEASSQCRKVKSPREWVYAGACTRQGPVTATCRRTEAAEASSQCRKVKSPREWVYAGACTRQGPVTATCRRTEEFSLCPQSQNRKNQKNALNSGWNQ